jgi:hypothetical protein
LDALTNGSGSQKVQGTDVLFSK